MSYRHHAGTPCGLALANPDIINHEITIMESGIWAQGVHGDVVTDEDSVVRMICVEQTNEVIAENLFTVLVDFVAQIGIALVAG